MLEEPFLTIPSSSCQLSEFVYWKYRSAKSILAGHAADKTFSNLLSDNSKLSII